MYEFGYYVELEVIGIRLIDWRFSISVSVEARNCGLTAFL